MYDAMHETITEVRTAYNDGVPPDPDAEVKDRTGDTILTFAKWKEVFVKKITDTAEEKFNEVIQARAAKLEQKRKAGGNSAPHGKKPKGAQVSSTKAAGIVASSHRPQCRGRE